MDRFPRVWAALLGPLVILGVVSLASAGQPKRLTLGQALDLALQKNPGLAVVRKELETARGALTQAKLYPFNPEFEAAFGYGRASAVVAGETGRKGVSGDAIGLSQVIEVKGQRGLRTRMAQANVNQVTWLVRDAERNVLADVINAFSEVIVVQEQVKLADEVVALTTELKDVAQKLFEAGAVPQLDLLRAEVELQRAMAGRTTEERRLTTARKKLNLLLGQPSELVFQAEGPLLLQPPKGDLPALLKRALDSRPDLKGAEAGLKRAEAVVALVEAERFLPEVKLSLLFQEDREFDTTDRRGVVGLSIPLPLWNRRQGDLEAALAETSRQTAQIALVKAEVEKEVSTAFQQMAASQQVVDQYVRNILPQQEKNFQLLRTGYDLGQFTLTDVLVGQREFIGAKVAYLEAIAAFNDASAGLYRAVGIRP